MLTVPVDGDSPTATMVGLPDSCLLLIINCSEAVDKGMEIRAVSVTSVKPSTEYGTRVYFLNYVL